MLEVGFRELKDSIKDIRDKQTARRPYYLSASIPVVNGGRARATLVCDRDADIYVFGLNGTVTAPATSAGRRLPNQATDFPMGVTLGGLAIDGFAERGLLMRVFDNSESEDQLSDPVNLMEAKNFLQPGYFIGKFARPYPFCRYLRRDSKLTFEFFNQETPNAEVFHFVNLTLSCRKYESFTR